MARVSAADREGGKAFPGTGKQAGQAPLGRLIRRQDYLAAKRGQRAHQAPFVMQSRHRSDADPARIGITVTRKVGGAVMRNRIKRRLKSAIATQRGLGFRPGYDYVLIARPLAASMPFASLVKAMERGLAKVHARTTLADTTTDTRPTAG